MSAQREEDSQSENEHVAWLGAVYEGGNWTVRAKMVVNDCEILFDLDSRAEDNTIRQQYVLRNQVKPTSLQLMIWNKSSEKPHLNCPLGISAVQHMNLVTINC